LSVYISLSFVFLSITPVHASEDVLGLIHKRPEIFGFGFRSLETFLRYPKSRLTWTDFQYLIPCFEPLSVHRRIFL